MSSNVLVVDLDGTLIKSDFMIESFFSCLSSKDLNTLELVKSFFRGKAQFKEFLALRYVFDPELLPYRREVLSLIEKRRLEGGQVVLATAANEKIANTVADHLRLFDSVLASTSDNNLSGESKAKKLVQEFGEKGFDYLGDSRKDLPVWKSSRVPYLVGTSYLAALRFKSVDSGVALKSLDKDSVISRWVKVLRVHQWAKNLLIAVPALTAQVILDPGVATLLMLAFISFSLLASVVYMVNDIFDIRSDRANHVKKNRPIARGDVSIQNVFVLVFFFLPLAFMFSLAVNSQFFLVLVGYLALTTAYTLVLKRVLVLDVVVLALMYTIRIIAGGVAVGVPVSYWLLAFSFFVFLSLSFVKRQSELLSSERDHLAETPGRAYRKADSQVINGLGVSSGMISVLVFALYLENEVVSQLYREPQVLWLLVPVLSFWISYVWVRSNRGEVDQDPVSFALKDRVSWLTAVLFLSLFSISQVGLLP